MKKVRFTGWRGQVRQTIQLSVRGFMAAVLVFATMLAAVPAATSAAEPGQVVNTNTGEVFTTNDIQVAINDEDTKDGHELVVGDGEYVGFAVGKELTIRSQNGPDATAIGTVSIGSSHFTLKGFTVTKASGGAAVSVRTNVFNVSEFNDIQILNNVIKGTDQTTGGVGIGVRIPEGTNITVSDNEITNLDNGNNPTRGILVGHASDVVITGNYIHSIFTSEPADGIYVEAESRVTITNNTFESIVGGQRPSGAIRVDDLFEADFDNPVREGPGNISARHNNFLVSGADGSYGVSTPSEFAANVHAELNYWGDPLGPGGSSGETGSSGAWVSPSIDYTPWLCAAYDGQASPKTSAEGCVEEDGTAPTVELTDPAEGSLYGTGDEIQVRASVQDENQVTYEVSLVNAGGETVASRNTADSPRDSFSDELVATFQADNFADGAYTVTLVATDEAGNQAEDSAGIAIDRTAPEGSLTNPDDGATVGGTVDVRATVQDANPESYTLRIEDSEGGVVYEQTYTAEPQTFTDQTIYSWDTTAVANGEYTLYLEAWDAAGNPDSGIGDGGMIPLSTTTNAVLDSVTVTVDNSQRPGMPDFVRQLLERLSRFLEDTTNGRFPGFSFL